MESPGVGHSSQVCGVAAGSGLALHLQPLSCLAPVTPLADARQAHQPTSPGWQMQGTHSPGPAAPGVRIMGVAFTSLALCALSVLAEGLGVPSVRAPEELRACLLAPSLPAPRTCTTPQGRSGRRPTRDFICVECGKSFHQPSPARRTCELHTGAPADPGPWDAASGPGVQLRSWGAGVMLTPAFSPSFTNSFAPASKCPVV